MNYNPNAGIRNPQGLGRKIKRVSDVNAMGPAASMPSSSPYMQTSTGPTIMDPMMGSGPNFAPQSTPLSGYAAGPIPMPQQNYGYSQPGIPNTQQVYPNAGLDQNNIPPGLGKPNAGPQQFGSTIPQFGMFQQPIVQDMAMQYGQRLADQGKKLMENQFEKWVPVEKLKYYFAVDNKYVANKIRLLFFPFLHKDWSLKYDQESPVQPRYELNAPDLYIPTMAYITYVVVAGLMLGIQGRFTPEQLGIHASSACAFSIFEMLIYLITIYVVNIKTHLKTLDILAFAGYKFVTIVACLLASTLFYSFGYYLCLAYCTLSLGFFLLRTLKTKVLSEAQPTAPGGAINYDPYGNPQQYDYSGGRKRKLYFLFLIVGGQALMMFLLSKHLYLSQATSKPSSLDL